MNNLQAQINSKINYYRQLALQRTLTASEQNELTRLIQIDRDYNNAD